MDSAQIDNIDEFLYQLNYEEDDAKPERYLWTSFISLSNESILSSYQNLCTLLFRNGITAFQPDEGYFQYVDENINIQGNEAFKSVISTLLQTLSLCERRINVIYLT